MTDVLGSLSFLSTPDVNGSLVLTDQTGLTSVTGTTNQISVSGSLPSYGIGLADNVILPGTASMTIPSGTTAQRPASPTSGMIRYNSTTGYIESYDTLWVQFTGLIDKSTTTATQTGTTSVSFVNYSVPANTLGTNSILRVTMGGIWVNTSTGTRTMTWTISYGGTTVWTGTTGTLVANTGSTAWNFEFNLIANNSVTAQTLSGRFNISANGAGGITTNTTTSPFTAPAIAGTSAVNSGNAQTLFINCVQNGATSVVTKYFHTIELL